MGYLTVNEVFAINQKCRNGVSGALPDCYLDEDSAVEMARSLANLCEEPRELTVGDGVDEAIVFRITDGVNTFEVMRLRIAY